MFKSELNSTDIYSDQSDIQDQIALRIQTTDQKWAHFFLNAQASDIKIRHRQLIYPAHRNIIFKHISLHALELQTQEGYLQIPQHLNPQLVQGVLSCLYSLQLKICRSHVLQILDIVHCLHITKLKRQIQDDIKANFDQYEIFPLLQKTLAFDMGEVQDLCLGAFENQSYQQVRYSRYDLLNCDEQTLKFVIQHHNQRRWEQPTFGLNEKYIQEVISQYCKHNNYTEKAKNKLTKQLGEMSVKTQFPSFKKIKIKTLQMDYQSESPLQIRVYTPRSFVKDSSISFKTFSQSPFQFDCSSTKSMIVDLTYMGDRKRKSSRGSENNNSQSKMCSDVITLKELNKDMQEYIQQLNETVQNLEKTIKQKEGEHRNMVFKVAEVESMLEQSEREIMEQNKQLLLLDIKLNKIIQRRINESEGAFDEQFQNIRGSNSSVDSQDQIGEQKEEGKSANKKDENLRVSLIQSKWVCC